MHAMWWWDVNEQYVSKMGIDLGKNIDGIEESSLADEGP